MIETICKYCGNRKLNYPSRIKKGAGKYCSNSCKGKDWAKKQEIFNIGHPQFNTGRTHFKKGKITILTEEQRKMISLRQKGKPKLNQRGPNCHLWKGGITEENHKIRTSVEFRSWRENVFGRDNWTCQKCGARNGNGKSIYLHSHHVKPFSEFKELRFDINNGITLCKDCHKLTFNGRGK